MVPRIGVSPIFYGWNRAASLNCTGIDVNVLAGIVVLETACTVATSVCGFDSLDLPASIGAHLSPIFSSIVVASYVIVMRVPCHVMKWDPRMVVALARM